jgi:hypothetical protein
MTAWLGAAGWSRLTAGVSLAVVAIVTGVISYIHIDGLTLALHQPAVVAHLYPFGVDGLVVIGGVVLLTIGKTHPWLGWLGVIPGVGASLFANWESGIRYGCLSAGWATVPAASFALSVMLFERWTAAQVSEHRGAAASVPPFADPVPAVANGHGTAWPAARPGGWS